jgi:hypothetical protein
MPDDGWQSGVAAGTVGVVVEVEAGFENGRALDS